MRPLALIALSLAALLAAGAAPAQTDPRLERERITKADTALARAITVRRSDLPAGWQQVSFPLQKPERRACRGFDPDFSRFTITGRAQSAFTHAAGASVISGVEVFATRAQAAGDFRAGTAPGVLPCVRELFARQLREQNDGSFTARIVSARSVRAPAVGERAVQFRVLARVIAGGQTVDGHYDFLVFQKGRSIVALLFTATLKPVAGQAAVARAVAARMR